MGPNRGPTNNHIGALGPLKEPDGGQGPSGVRGPVGDLKFSDDRTELGPLKRLDRGPRAPQAVGHLRRLIHLSVGPLRKGPLHFVRGGGARARMSPPPYVRPCLRYVNSLDTYLWKLPFPVTGNRPDAPVSKNAGYVPNQDSGENWGEAERIFVAV